MTVDANAKPVDVDENSNMAQIAEAIRANAATQVTAQTNESTAMVEKQHAHAREEAESKSLAKDSKGDGPKAPGTNRAGVYADMAMEAVGVGAVTQMAKTVCDVVRDGNNPFKHGDYTTIDEFVSGKGKKDEIKTKHSFDLATKGNLTGDALRGDAGNTKSWGGVSQTSAEFSKKLEKTFTAKLLSQKHLGYAKQMEVKVGAKIAKAQQFGMGSIIKERMAHAAPSLNIDLASGPTFRLPEEGVVTDDTSNWG